MYQKNKCPFKCTQPFRTNLGDADEELAPVRPGTGVGHAQDAGPGVLESEILVFELGPVDRRPPGPVGIVEVTPLVYMYKKSVSRVRRLPFKSYGHF